ncbi:ADP-ribosylation factor-like protein 2 [Cimex lectularius]|uniref:ADP-ribosylation factor-like protein 2 n=1 Tax=Cimex lectularius TaxID=79782 RepID=A0A8I6R9M5_CIMLE|nr:ADP-ribosylation factor-like protein 2 [Cimex lectularius]
MGFLSILKKLKEKEREMRVLILGLDNAGKTTLLKQLNNEDPTTISPTLGFNIKTVCYGEYKLNLWDVGGQKSLRSYWKNYFEQTDGVIWVVDSTDIRRLSDCAVELHKIIREERLVGASVLILANKADLESALSLSKIKSALELHKITSQHWKLMKCSAVTGENVITAMDWIVGDISDRLFTYSG